MCVLKDAAIFVLAVFAACRLNRLIVRDTITAPARAWLDKKTSAVGRFTAAAASCRWCAGVYVAAAVIAYAHYAADWSWLYYPLTAAAAAWLAPVIAQWLED